MEIAEMKRWLILAAALMLAAGGSLLVESAKSLEGFLKFNQNDAGTTYL
jgi:hypothetical protein